MQKNSSLFFSLISIMCMIFGVSSLMFMPQELQANITENAPIQSSISEKEFERMLRIYLENNPEIQKTPENLGLIFGE